MREEPALVISLIAIGAAVSQQALGFYRRNPGSQLNDLEVTIDFAGNEQTRSISVAPRNIKSVQNLLSAISGQSKPGNDQSTRQ